MRGRERNKTAGTRVRRSARSREFSRQQGWYQPRQTELGKRRIGQRNHDRGGYNWKIYNQATPLYFTNFPDDWSYGDMWRTFAKYGRVYDIYSPTKKDKNGKRFGFVRFLEVKNEAELEHQLVHAVESIPTLQEKFLMEGYFSCKVKPMGFKLVLLEGVDKDEIKDLVNIAPEWLGQWFKEVQPCDGDDVIASPIYVGVQAQVQWSSEDCLDVEDNMATRDWIEEEQPSRSQELVASGGVRSSRGVEGGGMRMDNHVTCDRDHNEVSADFVLESNFEQLNSNGEEKEAEGIMGEKNSKNNCQQAYSLNGLMDHGVGNGLVGLIVEPNVQWHDPRREIKSLGRNELPTNEIREEAMEMITNKDDETRAVEDRASRFTKSLLLSAEQIWQFAKQIGVADYGNEVEIVQKIKAMEARDKEEMQRAKEIEAGGRRKLWHDIKDLIEIRGGNWCLMGDFNSIKNEEERVGRSGSRCEIRNFADFIREAGLVDLSLIGRKFTWYQANGSSMSRLDRFLLSKEWLNNWGDLKQKGLNRTVSDHCPLLLKNEVQDWGSKPFRRFDAWLDRPGFKEKVTEVWNKIEVTGWMGYKGLFEGFEVGLNGMQVSHLQFADDTIIFGKATEENVWATKCIMRIFEVVSGLKINYGKSQLMGVCVEEDWQMRMAFMLNCKQGVMPFKYLGVPIGGNPRNVIMWKPLIESFKKKLSGWKDWQLVRSVLWRVLEAKYGNIGHNWVSWVSEGRNMGSLWWRDVRNINQVGPKKGWLENGFRLVVGEGKKVRFWWDLWAGDEVLANKYPRLFLLLTGKHNSISKMGCWQDGNWTWALRWRHKLFTWEENQLQDLMTIIEAINLQQGKIDEWTWIYDKKGLYIAKSGYLLLKQHLGNVDGWPYNKLWIPSIPSKEILDAFKQQFSLFKERSTTEGWITLWCSVLWAIWLARNEMIFWNRKANEVTIMELAQIRAFHWISGKSKLPRFDFNNWKLEPMLSMRK
ncbi:hypothetical protein SLEP1_g56430 [Rubroshorea leprosula]|uniref:RRM domain-containing protein n=1 Tax=Rubroshorea leprosula TaxID=152421 RepID=A0AAV5MMM8_9ROSI|nr:hypothetical protein SLEP1_g56430 [Rubroshorea leprosula]